MPKQSKKHIFAINIHATRYHHKAELQVHYCPSRYCSTLSIKSAFFPVVLSPLVSKKSFNSCTLCFVNVPLATNFFTSSLVMESNAAAFSVFALFLGFASSSSSSVACFKLCWWVRASLPRACCHNWMYSPQRFSIWRYFGTLASAISSGTSSSRALVCRSL